MGYTHYFEATRSFTDEEWAALTEKTNTILNYCEENNIIVRFESDRDKPAQVDGDRIRFNGFIVNGEDLGHETFVIYRDREDSLQYGSYFNFCKTARKPYDLAVALVLLAAHEVAPGVLDIGSDGGWDENESYGGGWGVPRQVYKELFGTEPCWVKEHEA